MIKLLRLDERLIHGQIAIKWSRHLGVDRIVVIDEAASQNETIKNSLLMAAPPTAKVAIKNLADGLALLQDPRAKDAKILVVVGSIDDLLKVTEEAPDIEAINIGNYGRMAPKIPGVTRKTFGHHLYAYDDEVEILKKVASKGISFIYQTTPEDSPEQVLSLLKKGGK